MDTTVSALETELQLLHWVFGIQITFNPDSTEVAQDASVVKFLEWFQMNHSHLMRLLIDPNTRLTKQD
jgi:hypothetical protein